MAANDVFSIFQFSLLVSFAAVISPGPVTAAILSEAPRKGWRSGPLIAFGHSVLELAILVLISFGLSVVMRTTMVLVAISIGGSLLLFWIGSRYILTVWKKEVQLPQPGQTPAARSSQALVALGMITTLANPFWYVWWVTVAAGYLTQAKAISAAAVAAFYLGHISADFAWDTALATATSSGRRWLSERAYQFLILITGGFMTYLGARYLVNALSMM
jgi:threonine/homoserine/homoserine lactone efflux protein